MSFYLCTNKAVDPPTPFTINQLSQLIYDTHQRPHSHTYPLCPHQSLDYIKRLCNDVNISWLIMMNGNIIKGIAWLYIESHMITIMLIGITDSGAGSSIIKEVERRWSGHTIKIMALLYQVSSLIKLGYRFQTERYGLFEINNSLSQTHNFIIHSSNVRRLGFTQDLWLNHDAINGILYNLKPNNILLYMGPSPTDMDTEGTDLTFNTNDVRTFVYPMIKV